VNFLKKKGLIFNEIRPLRVHEESKFEEGLPTDNTHESAHPPTDATID
jgi:hypothetical protein